MSQKTVSTLKPEPLPVKTEAETGTEKTPTAIGRRREEGRQIYEGFLSSQGEVYEGNRDDNRGAL